MSGLLSSLDLDHFGPHDIWTALEEEVQVAAGTAVFRHDWNDRSTKRDAVRAIALSIRFREVAVQKMPAEKRGRLLATRVPIDDMLASTLLMALHLNDRRTLLVGFLEALGIPQEDGMIADEYEFTELAAEALVAADTEIRNKFPDEQVNLYLASLLAMDDRWWGGIRPLLKQRVEAVADHG